jgi:hypothetical protein
VQDATVFWLAKFVAEVAWTLAALLALAIWLFAPIVWGAVKDSLRSRKGRP